MIFVNELDKYLRSFFYWANFKLYFDNFRLSDEVKGWKSFLDRNQRIFKGIEVSAEEFGFQHDISKAKGICGEKEETTSRMNFYLKFEGLKIYPRLLYNLDYIKIPIDFNQHKYYFTYYPKVFMPLFKKMGKEKWAIDGLTQFWTIGTHLYIKRTKEHRIAYNVSVPVNLYTIIEEELHALGPEVHGTTRTQDVLKSIQNKNPELQKEIESNLNHILSAEEKKFKSFGNHIHEEKNPELRIFERFCNVFEDNLIKDIDFSSNQIPKQYTLSLDKIRDTACATTNLSPYLFILRLA